MRFLKLCLVIALATVACGTSEQFTLEGYEARLRELCDEAAAASAGEGFDQVDEIADELEGMSGPEPAEDIGDIVADQIRAGNGCPELRAFDELERIYRDGSTQWQTELDRLRNG